MRLRGVALTMLLVLAGCATPFGVTSPDTTPGTGGAPDADSGTATTGGSATGTPATNPWGESTLTVGVVHSAGSWRNVTGHVAAAIEYWERHDATYGRYEVDFELRPTTSDPDVVVRYVEDISVCGSSSSDRGAGFAPRITDENPPDRPEYVCVRAGFDETSTSHVVTHEFGHLLGIRHGEPPRDTMRSDYEYLPVPRPGRDVQSASFRPRNLSMYVDRSDLFARRDHLATQQLDRTFRYYERGASGTLERNVTITEVDDRAEADVVITFPRQSPCERNRPGSCATLERKPDGTPKLGVAITTTHEDTFGWHAGFWLGVALGADHHRELPPPFRNASFDDRRGGWWTEDA